MVDTVGADMKSSSNQCLDRGRGQVWLSFVEISGDVDVRRRNQFVQHCALFVSNRPDPRLEVAGANLVTLQESCQGCVRRAGGLPSNVLDEEAGLVQVAELDIVDERAVHEEGGAYPFAPEDRRYDIVHLAESVVECQEQSSTGQRPASLHVVEQVGQADRRVVPQEKLEILDELLGRLIAVQVL